MTKIYYVVEAGQDYSGTELSYYYHNETAAYKMEALLAHEDWGWTSVVEFVFEDEEDVHK